MPDEPSAGELGRTLDRVERLLASEVRRLEREKADDLRKLREDVIKPLADRMTAQEAKSGLTVGRWAVIAMAVVAVLGLAVQAWVALKGAGK